MNIPSLILGLIVFAVVLYFIWLKLKNQKPQADTDTSRPSAELLPAQEKENDKLVIVKDISHTDLRTVLTGLCNLYNKERYLVQPRLTKITEREFAITFPFDIDFEIFCYFINYLKYPMDFDKPFNANGWTITKSGDTWITEKSADKKVMLFVPSDDTDHDNVFMTTIDNIGYKLGFALGEEKQLLSEPKRKFSSPAIDFADLANKEYEDFR